MGNHSKSMQMFASILFFFAAIDPPLQAAGSKWENLQTLKSGQLIRVELNDARSYDGAFLAVNDQGLTLRRAAGEQTFARKDVLSVYFKSKNHRARDVYLGAVIGAIFATPVALANGRNGWWRHGAWPFEVFVPAGGSIAAALPTGGWREVYRAPRHRG